MRKGVNVMIRNLLYISLFLCLIACKGNQQHEQTGVISLRIDNFMKKQYELGELFEVKVLDLHSDTSEYIGNIKDVTGIDSFIYTLDDLKSSVAKFNMNTGLLSREIFQRGNGPLEYVQPIALSADTTGIFLLDIGSFSILTFNKSLHAEKKIRLGFPAMDFVKVSDGFLCYNMSVSDTLRQVVYVDESGRIKKSFGSTEMSPKKMYSGAKIFSTDPSGNVYCALPFEQTVYRWNEDLHELCPFVAFDFGARNLSEDIKQEGTDLLSDNVVTNEFFRIDTLLVNSFLYKTKRYYGFSSIGSGECQAGTVVDMREEKPFFPRWQIGNILVASFSYDEIGEQEAKEKYGNALLMFKLKNNN